jgi:death-on-curing protein
MEYLTTHDLVWVNTIVTGEVNPYNYVTLEAAMAGQYRYGQSHDVYWQAANLLERLLFHAPFSQGNRRTAYISALTFLNANGYMTQASDAEATLIVFEVEHRNLRAVEAIAQLAAPADQPLPGNLTLRKLISLECNVHVEALKLLADGDV